MLVKSFNPLIGSNLFKLIEIILSVIIMYIFVSIPLIGSNLFKSTAAMLASGLLEKSFQSPKSGQICLNDLKAQHGLLADEFQSP